MKNEKLVWALCWLVLYVSVHFFIRRVYFERKAFHHVKGFYIILQKTDDEEVTCVYLSVISTKFKIKICYGYEAMVL